MAGELYTAEVRIGKETTAGTLVPATRKMYLRDPKLTRVRAPRPYMFATGTRDNVRGFTLGPQEVGGSAAFPLSPHEFVEFLLAGMKGGVTPTIPATAVNTRLWTFTPGTSLDSLTFEWNDGARGWRAAGVRVNSIKLAGAVLTENLVTLDLFGQSLIQGALTGTPADRTPTYFEGWETKLYLEAFGGVPGTTNIAGTLINWDVTIANGASRKFFADNSNAAGAVILAPLVITASLTFEASTAQALTEFNNWDAATKRVVRLEFGNNAIIEAAFKTFVTVDLPGAWSAFDLGASDLGTRTYKLAYQYVYDATNAFGVQIRCQNDRATAY